MPESSTLTTTKHDIADLEHLLEQKRVALEHEKSEKDMLREVVGEKIQTHAPSYVPTASSAPITKLTEPLSYLSQELKDKVQAFVDLVFSKNLETGIKEAIKSGNPALLDAFHDMLTDQLYVQLIEKRKLDKVE